MHTQPPSEPTANPTAEPATRQCDYDIAIIGAGMVGATLAHAVARLGLRTLVIEHHPLVENSDHPGYDDRAIALAWGSRQILESLALWPQLAAEASPIRQIHVSEQGRFGITRLHSRDYGVEALGYVVTGQQLGRVLLGRITTLPGVTLAAPAKLIDLQQHPRHIALTINEENGITQRTTRLLVAADGARSLVRQRLGIGAREWDYHQSAIITTLTSTQPRPALAFERFSEEGPLALLPLLAGRYAAVWSVAEERREQVMALDDGAFAQQLSACFGTRLGTLRVSAPRRCYPLRLVHADRLGHGRALLIGNAAHALHPITGQGFNLGLRDVAALADLLQQAQRQGSELGGESMVAAYSAARLADQRLLTLVTDGLIRLFTNPLPPLRLGRSLGLTLLDNSPRLKGALARRFMGLG